MIWGYFINTGWHSVTFHGRGPIMHTTARNIARAQLISANGRNDLGSRTVMFLSGTSHLNGVTMRWPWGRLSNVWSWRTCVCPRRDTVPAPINWTDIQFEPNYAPQRKAWEGRRGGRHISLLGATEFNAYEEIMIKKKGFFRQPKLLSIISERLEEETLWKMDRVWVHLSPVGMAGLQSYWIFV